MNCIEFRRIRLSDPYTNTKELSLHRSECEACLNFEQDIVRFDKDLYQALKVEVPEGLAAKVLLNQALQSEPRKPKHWSWMSLAACFFIVAMVSIYQLAGTSSIDKTLVEHIEQEQEVVLARSTLLEDSQIKQVLNSINLDADKSLGKVTFAANCLIDGEMVGHFVVEQGDVSYTVFVVPDGSTADSGEFEIANWRGVISQNQSGSSIAVLSQQRHNSEGKIIQEIADRVNRTIESIEV